MKNNPKTRLVALILCFVTLFFASCAPAPCIDSENPKNGAKTIVTQTIKLYQTGKGAQDIPAAHYEGCSEILLMDTETLCKKFVGEILGERGHEYTYEETDTTLTLKRSNGAYCTVDFVKDTMYFSDFDLFTAYGFGNMADILEYKYVDPEGKNIYFERTDSIEVAGLPVSVDLSKRGIPLDIYDGKKYIPFQTFNDIFLTPFYLNFVYNTKDLFEAFNGSIDPAFTDEYYSVEAKKRSDALIKYSTSELCLVLDLFYGLKEEHGVTDFESFFRKAGLWEDLNSPDVNESTTALASLMYGYLADKHSAVDAVSAYAGAPYIEGTVKYDASFSHFFEYQKNITDARAKIMPDGVEGYLEVGNTAYITFDAFTFSRERLSGYNENSADISDTVGLIVYAHSQINRENSPIENVVLDLSCNQGGETDIAIYVTAWMLGYCDFHATNPITGSYATTSYKVDVNLDGIFDENDTVANKNLYCLISNASFSGANLVPALLKESGRVTLLGATSGGGGCSVQFASMADGTVFQFSSNHYVSVVSNGAYYGIDRGVEPHFYITKVESYFDRDALTEHINGLK